MNDAIFRFYPAPFEEVPLRGIYLAHRVHELGSAERPFVYANFVSSLDGRIALQDTDEGQSYVPTALTTAHDFRLFLELQAQADCLITHAAYLRSVADQRLDDILQIGTRPETRDLGEWRAAQNLPAQPAVVVASASLDFVIPESLAKHRQRVYVATTRKADARKVARLQALGYEIVIAGENTYVEGRALVQALGGMGFRTLYLLAGPIMLGTMLRQRMLSRFYITVAHRVIAGDRFHTVVEGPPLDDAGRMELGSAYYDPPSSSRAGQFFLQFRPST